MSSENPTVLLITLPCGLIKKITIENEDIYKIGENIYHKNTGLVINKSKSLYVYECESDEISTIIGESDKCPHCNNNYTNAEYILSNEIIEDYFDPCENPGFDINCKLCKKRNDTFRTDDNYNYTVLACETCKYVQCDSCCSRSKCVDDLEKLFIKHKDECLDIELYTPWSKELNEELEG